MFSTTERLIYHINMDAFFAAVEQAANPKWQNRPVVVLTSITPLVEPYSIDEAFLDLTANPEAQANPLSVARRIKQRIAREFKSTCSIGIANNKLIAKMASDNQKPNGLTWVPPEETLDWLHKLPVERLPGMGDSMTSCLQGLNIRTIGDLALIDENVLIGWFGKNGSHLYQMAWGREEGLVNPELSALKSVIQEWALPRDNSGSNKIKEAV